MDQNEGFSSTELLTMVGRFVDELAEADPDPIRRSEWIVYALKALAEKSNQTAYEEMLKNIAEAITNRLTAGQW